MKSIDATSETIDSDDYHCLYNGQKVSVEDTIKIGCEKICKCMDRSGRIECEKRCPQTNQTANEQCVMVPDPKDSCCQIELCDVTLDDHEQTSGGIVIPSLTTSTMPEAVSNAQQLNDDNARECIRNGTKYKVGESYCFRFLFVFPFFSIS